MSQEQSRRAEPLPWTCWPHLWWCSPGHSWLPGLQVHLADSHRAFCQSAMRGCLQPACKLLEFKLLNAPEYLLCPKFIYCTAENLIVWESKKCAQGYAKFASSMIFLNVCSLASRKVVGDTSVYILFNVLESWASPETFRQCWKILTVAVSGLEVFFIFFPPSRTAFERHFCYANRFLPAAAELSTVGARKEPADTARKVGALFPAAHQAQHYCPSQPCWLNLALC